MIKKNIFLYIFAFIFVICFTLYLRKYFSSNELDKNFYKFYLIIFFILSIIFISSVFFTEKIKLYILIITTCTVISFYLFELYLVLKNTKNKTAISKIEYYKNSNKKKDEYTIALDLTLNQNNNKIYPLAGISNMKTIHCNENEYFSEYISDRYGFNNPDLEWDKIEIEYLIVGDSFTHGNCVNRPNDISSVIRNHSNKNVLNLGYQNKGTLSYYATLKEYFPNAKVKKILLLHYENDINDLSFELNNNILNSYITNPSFTQNLREKQDIIDNLIKKIIYNELTKEQKNILYDNKKFDLKNFVKLNSLRSIIHARLSKNYSPKKNLFKFREVIKLIKKLADENNSKLFFINLPNYERYKYNFIPFENDNIREIMNTLNIPFIDIHDEVFKKEDNPLSLFPNEMFGHYNVEGYKKIGKKIYQLTD